MYDVIRHDDVWTMYIHWTFLYPVIEDDSNLGSDAVPATCVDLLRFDGVSSQQPSENTGIQGAIPKSSYIDHHGHSYMGAVWVYIYIYVLGLFGRIYRKTVQFGSQKPGFLVGFATNPSSWRNHLGSQSPR